MINGERILSFKHLFKRLEFNKMYTLLILSKRRQISLGKAYKVVDGSKTYITILNKDYGGGPFSVSTFFSCAKKLANEVKEPYSYMKDVLTLRECDCESYDSACIFNGIEILPDDFDESFNSFVSANAKLVEQISCDYGVGPKDISSRVMYYLSGASKNYYQWLVTMWCHYGITLHTLRDIMYWSDVYGTMAKDLKRGTIIAYNNREKVISLIKEITELREEKRVKNTISMFNTQQKKLLRDVKLNASDKMALAKFYKLSEAKKHNFIRKVSTFTSGEEILEHMRFATSIHFSWDKKSLKGHIENMDDMECKIVIEGEDFLLLQVYSYDTLKYLAKTTNWCISKNKSYFNNYLTDGGRIDVKEDSKIRQYMLFDFSKKEDSNQSIVGFTVCDSRGITHAHDFVNNNIMANSTNKCFLIKSYLKKFLSQNSINGILEAKGIDASTLCNYPPIGFEWTKKSFEERLHKFIDKDNITVVKDEDDKMVVIAKDKNIASFFGDTYCERVSVDYWSNPQVIFADFTKPSNNQRALMFAILCNEDDEDYVIGLYSYSITAIDAYFDILLAEYGLPYDTIRRTNNVRERVENALLSLNFESLKGVGISDTEIATILVNYQDKFAMVNAISNSILTYLSFDYLDLLYDNGYTITDVESSASVGGIIESLVLNLYDNWRYTFRGEQEVMVTKESVDRFYSNSLTTENEAKFVGYYLALMTIIEKEPSSDIAYERAVSDLYNSFAFSKLPLIFSDVVMAIARKYKHQDSYGTTKNLLQLIAKTNHKDSEHEIVRIASQNKEIAKYVSNNKKLNVKVTTSAL